MLVARTLYDLQALFRLSGAARAKKDRIVGLLRAYFACDRQEILEGRGGGAKDVAIAGITFQDLDHLVVVSEQLANRHFPGVHLTADVLTGGVVKGP